MSQDDHEHLEDLPVEARPIVLLHDSLIALFPVAARVIRALGPFVDGKKGFAPSVPESLSDMRRAFDLAQAAVLLAAPLMDDTRLPIGQRWTTRLFARMQRFRNYFNPMTSVRTRGDERMLRLALSKRDWSDEIAHLLEELDGPIADLKALEIPLMLRASLPASPNGTRVLLRGRAEGPIVLGKPKRKLTTAQYNVVKALLDAGDAGLTKDELERKGQSGDARGVLRRLAKKDADWKAVIHFAGQTGGGYRIK